MNTEALQLIKLLQFEVNSYNQAAYYYRVELLGDRSTSYFLPDHAPFASR